MTRDASALTGRRTVGTGGRTAANLTGRTKYTPEPDPLTDVDYTGDLQEDTAREFTALEQGYRDRAKNEADRFKRATDSEYWFAVCFTSREEKNAFLDRLGLTPIGDKYLPGDAVAAALNL